MFVMFDSSHSGTCASILSSVCDFLAVERRAEIRPNHAVQSDTLDVYKPRARDHAALGHRPCVMSSIFCDPDAGFP